MPSSGARSGTRPSRSERGAGDGSIPINPKLVCGHEAESRFAVATYPSGKQIFRCREGCGLQERKPR